MTKTIHELNETRIKLSQYVEMLGMRNAYGLKPEDHLKLDAEYKLSRDALFKAEQEYRDAISGLSADELSELATGKG